jgi:isoleucyl-tRNA synthetase
VNLQGRPRSITGIYTINYLINIYIENSKSIISDSTPKETRLAVDTLYTTIESGLRLVSLFMPFLTKELWQRLLRRLGDNTSSITMAKYLEYKSFFYSPISEVAYELILGCLKGILLEWCGDIRRMSRHRGRLPGLSTRQPEGLIIRQNQYQGLIGYISRSLDTLWENNRFKTSYIGPILYALQYHPVAATYPLPLSGLCR